MTACKELDFKIHPLAPCVVTMYAKTSKGKEILIGVISIETDDLLGRGIGPKWTAAIVKYVATSLSAVGNTYKTRLKNTVAVL